MADQVTRPPAVPRRGSPWTGQGVGGLVRAEAVLGLVAALSGVPLKTLRGPRRTRRVSRARTAAMYLLRTEAGLSARQVGEFLGRSASTVLDLSRQVARGERAGDLVARVRQALGAQARNVDPATTRWTARPVPGLSRARLAAGLSQEELAGRAQVARETVLRLERGRPAQVGTIRRLAAVLSLPPAVLEDAPDRNDLSTPEGLPADPGLSALGHAGPEAPRARHW